MQLFFDSGATKCDCILLDDHHQYLRHLTFSGINANYHDDAYIFGIFEYFRNEILKFTDEQVVSIEYYGAGCGNEINARRVYKILLTCFPNATIEVASDLLGACRLLCRQQSGLVAILGTGASACLYNGHDIAVQAPSLGFLLGDEGSGTYIGKLFITNYLRNELPMELKSDFEQHYSLDNSKVLHRIYQEKSPNLFFSSLAPFIAKHKKIDFIQDLLQHAFSDFFEKQICYFDDYQSYPLNIMGSVAFHFADDLKKIAHNYQVTMGNITASPLQYLQ